MTKAEALRLVEAYMVNSLPVGNSGDAIVAAGGVHAILAALTEPQALSDVDVLRGRGWTVAIHNDYRMDGKSFTFWLFAKGDHSIKGEGRSDFEALQQCVREADRLDAVVRVKPNEVE